MPPQDSPAFLPALVALLLAWGVALPVGGGGVLLWAADRWVLAGRAGGGPELGARPPLGLGRALACAGAATLAAVPAFWAGLATIDWAYRGPGCRGSMRCGSGRRRRPGRRRSR